MGRACKTDRCPGGRIFRTQVKDFLADPSKFAVAAAPAAGGAAAPAAKKEEPKKEEPSEEEDMGFSLFD